MPAQRPGYMACAVLTYAVPCCVPVQVGLVFQFPERHFLGDDVMQEMTFTWPRAMSHWGERQAMAVRMQQVSCAHWGSERGTCATTSSIRGSLGAMQGGLCFCHQEAHVPATKQSKQWMHSSF